MGGWDCEGGVRGSFLLTGSVIERRQEQPLERAVGFSVHLET